MAYQALEKLINLHDGFRRVYRVGNRDLLLFQEEGRVHIVDRLCPHQGHALDQAHFDGVELICPQHQVHFDALTGAATPAICAALSCYTVVYEGNTLGVDVDGR